MVFLLPLMVTQAIRSLYDLHVRVVHPCPHIRLHLCGLVPVVLAAYLVVVVRSPSCHVYLGSRGLAHRSHRLRCWTSPRSTFTNPYEEFATLTSI